MHTHHLDRLVGVIPPLITPLDDRGEIDEDAEQRLIHRLVSAGVNAIFVLGTSGEGPWLTSEFRSRVVRAACDASGEVPILAGIIEPSTARALEAAEEALDAGADMLVVASPYYFPVGALTQIAHVTTIAKEFPVPILIYNIPQTTKAPIEPQVVRELAPIENIVGMKDSGGDWDTFKDFLEIGQQHALRVLQGAENLVGRSVMAGAAGAVPGLSNVFPSLFVELVQAAAKGETERVSELQATVDRAGSVVHPGFWLENLKFAVSLLGFGTPQLVARPRELSLEAADSIARLVESGLE